jgi:hypothetical protein
VFHSNLISGNEGKLGLSMIAVVMAAFDSCACLLFQRFDQKKSNHRSFAELLSDARFFDKARYRARARTNGGEARETLQSLGIRPRIIIWEEGRLTSTHVHLRPHLLRDQFEGNFNWILKNCFKFSKLITAFNSLPDVYCASRFAALEDRFFGACL